MKPLLSALKGNVQDIPPLWLMRQAGRYLPEYRKIRASAASFLDMCYSPELAAEVTLQPIRRFRFDAAIIFSDILVVPHALGQSLCYVEGQGPVLEPIRDIKKLKSDRIEEHLDPVFQEIRLVKKELPGDVALIGFAGAPWTVATYMIEGGTSRNFTKVKQFALKDKETFQALVKTLVDATVRYLEGQIKAGAEVIQIFDSWAGVLAPKQFDEWVIQPTRIIVGELKKKYPHVPVIGFPKGAGMKVPEYVKKTGVDAIGLDYTLSRRWAHAALDKKIPVQGNLDPAILAASKKETIRETREMMKDFSGRPHIVNLGHGILPETPIEHVHALIETVRGKKA